MAKTLSEDLRGRVIAAVEAGASRRAAAERFGIGVATAAAGIVVGTCGPNEKFATGGCWYGGRCCGASLTWLPLGLGIPSSSILTALYYSIIWTASFSFLSSSEMKIEKKKKNSEKTCPLRSTVPGQLGRKWLEF